MSLSPLRILTYANCSLNYRSAIEGEQILKSKQIILCGKIEMDSVIQIRALIVQTSHLNDMPHSVFGELTKPEMEIIIFKCSCKAGASECCKHVVAILLFLNRSRFIAAAPTSAIALHSLGQCGLVIDVNNPWLGYSPDGVIIDEYFVPIKIIEIKCPFDGKKLGTRDLLNSLKWIVKHPDGSLSLKKKHCYYAQVQMGIVLLNVMECDFIVHSSYENKNAVLKVIYFERLIHE
ncbi:hypothetical protein AGLY_008821, partial [Aphis glycines]